MSERFCKDLYTIYIKLLFLKKFWIPPAFCCWNSAPWKAYHYTLLLSRGKFNADWEITVNSFLIESNIEQRLTPYRKPENINLKVKKKNNNRPNGSVTYVCFVRSHESKAKQDGNGKRGHNKTKDLIGRTIAQHERFNTMLYIYSRPLQNNLTWSHQNLRAPRTKTTAVNNLSCYLELDVMAELIYIAP